MLSSERKLVSYKRLFESFTAEKSSPVESMRSITHQFENVLLEREQHVRRNVHLYAATAC